MSYNSYILYEFDGSIATDETKLWISFLIYMAFYLSFH